MDESPKTSSASSREPLPYHRALAEYLQSHHAELWSGQASEASDEDHANAVLLELNKTSKPLTEDSAPELLKALITTKTALDLEEVPIMLWEVPEGEVYPNCSVFWVSGEAHVAIKKTHWLSLTEAELQALLTSALMRWQLWNGYEGRFRTAERVLLTLLHHFHREGDALRESWKRWNIATDTFAGQAPEASTSDESPRFGAGPVRWERLDLLERQRVSDETRRAIRRLLQPAWFQTPSVLAHAWQFFPDFSQSELSAEMQDAELPAGFSLDDPPLRDYFCYLLLDFATADRELAEKSFPECLKLARELGCETRFAEVISEELDWTPEQIEHLLGDSPSNDRKVEQR